jgi:hypothetical protein
MAAATKEQLKKFYKPVGNRQMFDSSAQNYIESLHKNNAIYLVNAESVDKSTRDEFDQTDVDCRYHILVHVDGKFMHVSMDMSLRYNSKLTFNEMITTENNCIFWWCEDEAYTVPNGVIVHDLLDYPTLAGIMNEIKLYDDNKNQWKYCDVVPDDTMREKLKKAVSDAESQKKLAEEERAKSMIPAHKLHKEAKKAKKMEALKKGK